MNRWKQIATNLLLAVFVGIILMKPAHLLLVDHHGCDNTAHSEKQDSKSHDNCTICQFAFDVSSQAIFPSVEEVYRCLISEIKRVEKVSFIAFSLTHFTPRAPPAHFSLLFSLS